MKCFDFTFHFVACRELSRRCFAEISKNIAISMQRLFNHVMALGKHGDGSWP